MLHFRPETTLQHNSNFSAVMKHYTIMSYYQIKSMNLEHAPCLR